MRMLAQRRHFSSWKQCVFQEHERATDRHSMLYASPIYVRASQRTPRTKFLASWSYARRRYGSNYILHMPRRDGFRLNKRAEKDKGNKREVHRERVKETNRDTACT
mmetsp:Transcript_51086/g.159640  ORF Transcript_51086/g.159640 Transcript_51086/m.159640 type:complete len:106 (+) Transcript_51086:887-1204(+)